MIRRVSLAWLGLVVVLSPLARLTVLTHHSKVLADRLYNEQDLWVLYAIGEVALALTVALFLTPWLAPRAARACRAGFRALGRVRSPFGGPAATTLAVAVLVVIVTWVGRAVLFGGYALSVDEFKAHFDAVILAHGAPMAPVAAAWRPFIAALEPQFTLHSAGGAFWVSSYLPVDAGLRALGGLVGAEALVNPILAAVAVVAVYAVGRRLWPERTDLPLIAAILLATSSQFLLTAMTAYAMTAHLAFNLVWLWLFLRGGRLGHAGALVVGFFACGLHQLAFHPLFAAPFVLQLFLERRWRLGVLYTLAYAAICAFWVDYGAVALALVGATPDVGANGVAGSGRFASQVQALMAGFKWSSAGMIGQNLARFVTWQNLMTAPLAVLGVVAALKANGTTRSLLLGVVLTTAVLFLVMPYQGYGWGYRYWHGLLGSFCLLAALAWGRLSDGRGGDDALAARGALVAVTAASALVLFPLRAWQAHGLEHPYAAARAAIARAPGQVVLVDPAHSWFTADLVRNDPYLRRPPWTLDLDELTQDQVGELCGRYTISVFDARDAALFGIRAWPAWRAAQGPTGRVNRLLAASCGHPRTAVGEIVPTNARRG